jgi:hypothetical protein
MGEYGKKLYELQNKVIINVQPMKFGVEEVECVFFGGRNIPPLLYVFFPKELCTICKCIFSMQR